MPDTRTDAAHMPDDETTMFSALLERLRSEDIISIAELARITGLDQRTIARWCSGDTDPHFRNVHLIYQHGGFDVQAAIIHELTANTGWVATYVEDTDDDLDVNGDGRIDVADSISAQLNALHNLSDLLGHMDRDRNGSDRVTDAALAHYVSLIDQVFRLLLRGKRVIEHVHKEQSRRRKARRLPMHS